MAKADKRQISADSLIRTACPLYVSYFVAFSACFCCLDKEKWYKTQRKKSGDLHVVAQQSDNDDSDTGLTNLEMYSLKGDVTKAIWLTPQVNGQIINMELDTGSAVSVMSQGEFFAVKLLNVKLQLD